MRWEPTDILEWTSENVGQGDHYTIRVGRSDIWYHAYAPDECWLGRAPSLQEAKDLAERDLETMLETQSDAYMESGQPGGVA